MPRSKAFERMYKSMKKEYLNKDVPKVYQKRYGKKYTSKDVKSIAYSTAKKLGIKA